MAEQYIGWLFSVLSCLLSSHGNTNQASNHLDIIYLRDFYWLFKMLPFEHKHDIAGTPHPVNQKLNFYSM